MRFPISVSKYVMMRLKAVSVYPDESYESILSRLLDCKIGLNKLEYFVCFQDLVVRVCVDWDADCPRLSYFDGKCFVSEFPLDLFGNSDVSICFKELLCEDCNLFGVLAILEPTECTVYNGLKIFRK